MLTESLLQDPRVLDAMLPYLTSYYGNPHSRTHMYGWESERAVEAARKVCSGATCRTHKPSRKTFAHVPDKIFHYRFILIGV